MTHNCFDKILSVLHFNDNNLAFTSLDHNKFKKIQPIIEYFNTRFNEFAIPKTNEYVAEIKTLFKGKYSAKVHMPKTPIKWG